jgi:hypothetical protein
MPDENVDKGVPFLLCIPPLKRGNVIEKLARYQKKKYGLALDLDIRAAFPEIPAPEIATPLPVNADERERELEHLMKSNSDIKGRMK